MKAVQTNSPSVRPNPSATARTAGTPAPGRLLAVTALSVFVGEVIVMLVLAVVPALPTFAEALLDGLMITALATPVLLLFLFRPMVAQIRQRRAAEEALQTLNDELELRVAERTRELTTANESLKREIAGRLTAESSLSRSTDFIRRVLAAAPCVLAIYDLNTLHCTFINERVEDLLGYSPDDVIVSGPQFFADVFAAADHQRFRELSMRMAAGVETEIATCTCRLRTAGGEPRSFGIGLVRIAEADGSVRHSALLAAVPIAADSDDAAGRDAGAGSGRLAE